MSLAGQILRPPPVVVVDSHRWRPSLDTARELWAYREVLFALVVRYFKVKYKQAVIGVGWTVAQPIIAALLFSIFLGRFAKLPSEHVPYFVFALAGLTAWNFFASAVASAADSIVRDGTVLRKVYFPREALPLSAVGAALADLPAALVILLLVTTASGIRPSLAWLALPLPILILVMAAAGIGLLMSTLNVYYRDVRHMLPFILQALLFASPIVYSIQMVPERWRLLYGTLNPVATAVEDIRRAVLHGVWPDPLHNLGALATSLVLLAGGYYLLKLLERDFADRV